MSVLMRGVEMPKNCEECNFKGECRNYWHKIREAYTIPSWCPLVEVAEQTEPQSNARKFLGYACETCKHRDEEWDSEACDGCCKNNDHYEQTEPNCSEKPNNSKVSEIPTGSEPQKQCGNCKWLTYRFNKVWCDIKCDNPHDEVCDRWTAQTDCPWK